jgi:hypothetical protein
MALRLLSGAKPQDIPTVKGVNTYMFDWRALKRWGLRESDLPPESVVLFREVASMGRRWSRPFVQAPQCSPSGPRDLASGCKW